MKHTFRLCMVILLSAWGAGCSTLSEPTPEEARREADIQMMAQRLNELREQVNAVQLENQTLVREMEGVRTVSRGSGATLQSRLEALEKQVQTLQRARAEDRQAIIDDISRKMQSLMASSAGRSSSSSSGGGAVSDSGYEHVVKSGETLSEIARAYGVNMSAIRQANRMKNDTVRVGQKLFIPEKR